LLFSITVTLLTISITKYSSTYQCNKYHPKGSLQSKENKGMENLQCGGRGGGGGGGNPNSDFFGKYVKRAKKGHFYLSVFLPIWAVSKCQLILDSSLKHKRGKGDSKE